MKNKINKDELYDLYVNKGMDTKDISIKMNVAVCSICRAYKRFGIQLRSKKSKPRYFYDGINKQCSICGEIKSIKHFQKEKGNRATGLRGECNQCRYKNRSEWYNLPGKKDELKRKRRIYANRKDIKEKRRIYQKERWQEDKELGLKIKSECGCQVCGEKRINCLDFHHIIPVKRTKRKNRLYDTVNYFYGMSKKRTLKEISKCCILCANCHRLVHSGDIRPELIPIDVSIY